MKTQIKINSKIENKTIEVWRKNNFLMDFSNADRAKISDIIPWEYVL